MNHPVFSLEENLIEVIEEPDKDLADSQDLVLEMKKIRENLAKLKEDQQNAIIWRYLDGLSAKEIAEMLEKEEGTVRVMIHRALQELKKLMEKK